MDGGREAGAHVHWPGPYLALTPQETLCQHVGGIHTGFLSRTCQHSMNETVLHSPLPTHPLLPFPPSQPSTYRPAPVKVCLSSNTFFCSCCSSMVSSDPVALVLPTVARSAGVAIWVGRDFRPLKPRLRLLAGVPVVPRRMGGGVSGCQR